MTSSVHPADQLKAFLEFTGLEFDETALSRFRDYCDEALIPDVESTFNELSDALRDLAELSGRPVIRYRKIDGLLYPYVEPQEAKSIDDEAEQ